MSVIQENLAAFDLYAYPVSPMRFGGRAQIPITMPGGATEDRRGYAFLGYDVVARAGEGPFGCSPFSCNNGCGVFRVNLYCLLAELDDAWAGWAQITAESSKRDAYGFCLCYLVEVLRKRGHSTQTAATGS
jgi:hypothetical protein